MSTVDNDSPPARPDDATVEHDEDAPLARERRGAGEADPDRDPGCTVEGGIVRL